MKFLLYRDTFPDDKPHPHLSLGMFNAINGMGAGGQRAGSTSLVAKANSALYACFSIVGLFSGSIINTLGPQIPLMM
jgi:hypothetical protein